MLRWIARLAVRPKYPIVPRNFARRQVVPEGFGPRVGPSNQIAALGLNSIAKAAVAAVSRA
jgi:hypothetical protein